MKIRGVLVVIIMSFLAFGCSSTKKVLVDNPELDEMMGQEAFEIVVKAAEPQVTMALAQIGNSSLMRPGNTISRIDVTGGGYFIKLNGEKVSANLPYFGERQMGGGYGSDAGIIFDDIPARNLTIVKDEEKNSYVTTFSVDNSSENYFFTVDTGSTLNTTVRVRSSHRNRIRFTGTVKALEAEDFASN